MTLAQTASIVEFAVQYRQRGLSVIPVGRDKRPLVEWGQYQRELPHPDQVTVWWDHWPEANIGVATGAVSDLVVLDADGPRGLASLKALDTPATTWLSKTGRAEGGWQQFFKHPGRPIRNRAGLRPGLDVRGDGGYVIVPPSVHASGRHYEWLTAPSDLPLAPLPEIVLELLLARPPAPPSADVSGDAIPQGQRDATLASLAGSMRRRGMTADEILAALAEVNRRRCRPPLLDADVRRIATSIGRYPAGEAAAEEAPPVSRLTVVPVEAHALLGRTYTDPPAIVAEGIFPRQALGIVGGPPKVGKSSLIMNLLLRRAAGSRWLGFETTPGRSLILNAEVPEPQLQTRLARMLEGTETALPNGRLFFATHRGIHLDRGDGLAAVRDLLERFEPDLLAIDPLARFFAADENSARDVGRLIGALDELIQRYRVAILLAHHTAKPSATDPRQGGQRLRGSSALFGAADTVMLLDRDEGAFKLAFDLRHGREPEPMRLERSERLWFSPVGPPEDLLAVAATVRMLPMAWGHLVAALKADHDVSKATAERLIQRALKAHLITKNGAGAYIATLTHPQDTAAGETSAHE